MFAASIVIALVVGTIAQLVTGYRKHRIFTTLVLGLIGVFIGNYAAYRFHLPHMYMYFFDVSIFWAIVGAVLFIVVFRLIRGRW